MSLSEKETYTIDDLQDLPEGERAELIDGKLYYMASPGLVHQQILMELSYAILHYIKQHDGICKVLPAPFAVYLDELSNTYVEPDISVICDANKLDDKGCHGAPDWVIEIVSESSKKMDCILKLYKYELHGVREYWMVIPSKERVVVWNFETMLLKEYPITGAVPVGIFPGLTIDFGQLDLFGK